MAKTCKYYKQQKYVSYNSGATWQPLNEYRRGSLYESQSADCGGGITLYRWFELSSASTYWCEGYNKWTEEVYQESIDNGATWTNVIPEQTRKGQTLIERNSDDCGYPPTPSQDTKYMAFSSERTYSAQCDSSSILTSGETIRYDSRLVSTAVIGDCVTTIGSRAFGNFTSLADVIFGSGVTTIGEGAFSGCTSLTNVTLPNIVTSIGMGAFLQCTGLTSINIPSGVTIINDFTFNACKSLTNIEIPSGVTSIGMNGFGACESLTSVTIPNTVTSISKNAFIYCLSLPSITIPSGVTSIGSGAFSDCDSLTSVGGVGSGASVEIPTNITSISDHLFFACNGLTSVTIPSWVTSIGSMSFNSCESLTSVTVLATTPPALDFGADGQSRPFDNEFNYNYPIYVPSGSVNAYKSAANWSYYKDRIQGI